MFSHAAFSGHDTAFGVFAKINHMLHFRTRVGGFQLGQGFTEQFAASE
jgi:hypothetical protein